VAQEQISADALLRWLSSRRRASDSDDAAQLRLESDRNLVQIVTIHKSKGLEYPIVFCPFLWDGYRNTRVDTPDLIEYHDREGTAVLDFRPDSKDDKLIQPLRRDEAAAETLRLIYVAVTRAVHRCYLMAGCYSGLSFGRVTFTESARSMLNWLVCGDGQDVDQWFTAKPDPERIDGAWTGLGDCYRPDCAVDALPGLIAGSALEPESARAACSARPAPGPIPESWNRGSFSGMIRNLSFESVAADHDTGEDVASPLQAGRVEEGLEGGDILAFPRGPAAGECIHHLFEHIDFTDPQGWDAAIDDALAVHPQGNVPAGADSLKPQLRGMLEAVLATDLGSGIQLRAVKSEHRLNELAFTLPAERLQAEVLNPFLREHGYAVGRLDFPTLNGYLSGAIDLVFFHGGHYYLLDWKSNHLGDARLDYAQDLLEQAMTHHAYRLQYLLYSVALHRYLQRRLPDYDYERHFGGVFYLFVRGVRPGWTTESGPAGVFFDRPSASDLMTLDTLIGRTDRGVSS
jgi:exodeoxyribonuclease V beta subunit